MSVVLDADVLIGALDAADPHHERARALFLEWHDEERSRVMSVVNLSEILVAPSADPRRLRAARQAIGSLGVGIHRPDEGIGVDAAGLRARRPISLADAYCLATARHLGRTVVSFDRKVVRAAIAEQIPHVALD